MLKNEPYMDERRMRDRLESLLESRPICNCCDEHIQEEKAVHIMGMWFCVGCINDYTEFFEGEDE